MAPVSGGRHPVMLPSSSPNKSVQNTHAVASAEPSAAVVALCTVHAHLRTAGSDAPHVQLPGEPPRPVLRVHHVRRHLPDQLPQRLQLLRVRGLVLALAARGAVELDVAHALPEPPDVLLDALERVLQEGERVVQLVARLVRLGYLRGEGGGRHGAFGLKTSGDRIVSCGRLFAWSECVCVGL